MDTITEERLQPLCPSFVAAVTRAITSLAAQSIVVRVTSGLRTYAEQDALYAIGRTVPGQKVTKARGGFSNHNFGLAVDCVPGKIGVTPWQPNWDVPSAGFQAMIKAMKHEGLEWGGDWVHFPDEDHFQATSIPPSPDDAMRACYLAGGMPQVWKTYGMPVDSPIPGSGADPTIVAV